MSSMFVIAGHRRLHKLHKGQTNLNSRDGHDIYLETTLNSELHLKYGQYQHNHSEAYSADGVLERVINYI
jgi:hypothetical protein